PYALKANPECEMKVISPYYRVTRKGDHPVEKVKEIKGLRGFGDMGSFTLLRTVLDGVEFYFIDKEDYYDRDNLYGTPEGDYTDNARRFGFFSYAVLASMAETGYYPDVIHANDWETALIPLYRDLYIQKGDPLGKVKVLYAIHNLAYQGRFDREEVENIGLTEEYLEAISHEGKINFMKAGILYSDAVSTVSKKYAQEMLTKEYGCGLENVLHKRREVLYGILNGADYSKWNPETDKFIPENYNRKTLDKKQVCKKELIKRMNINIPLDKPLLGSVGRLTGQKGIDIIVDSISHIVKAGAGLALLGTGEKRYEDALVGAGSGKKQIGISIGFDERLAHMIEAGSDMFILPSRYEPCGLNQMYSLKYGTIPIVRATGGLDDTVIDYSLDQDRGNGFKFDNADSPDFVSALERAFALYEDKEAWRNLQRKGMSLDFSWNKSAQAYAALYRKLLEKT
ncbi:MAG: glycogen synthase, partial [Candidatus Omnitrophica bacterium]|nr:glycogen synthase [Candidatus Omnitrophota bacterium]